MLSTVTWVPRGFAVANPAAYDDAPEAVEGPEAAALALAQQRQLERAGALEAGATASGEDEAMDSTSRSPHTDCVARGAADAARRCASDDLVLLSCRSPFPVCPAAGDGDDVVSKYGLSGYEQEDEGIAGALTVIVSSCEDENMKLYGSCPGINMFGKLSGEKDGMMYHESNQDDPYLKEGGAAMEDSDEDEDEDTAVRPSDMLVATTRCEEVWPSQLRAYRSGPCANLSSPAR